MIGASMRFKYFAPIGTIEVLWQDIEQSFQNIRNTPGILELVYKDVARPVS